MVIIIPIPTTIIKESSKFEKNDRFNGDGDGGGEWWFTPNFHFEKSRCYFFQF